jgi:Fe2+ transport system protein FeoA
MRLESNRREDGNRVDTELLLPLELVHGGESAEIVEVAGEPSSVTRLAELGVRAGSRLRVLQPGSPCLLQIGGARLSLRPDRHIQILVRPLATPA